MIPKEVLMLIYLWTRSKKGAIELQQWAWDIIGLHVAKGKNNTCDIS